MLLAAPTSDLRSPRSQRSTGRLRLSGDVGAEKHGPGSQLLPVARRERRQKLPFLCLQAKRQNPLEPRRLGHGEGRARIFSRRKAGPQTPGQKQLFKHTIPKAVSTDTLLVPLPSPQRGDGAAEAAGPEGSRRDGERACGRRPSRVLLSPKPISVAR